MKMNSNHLVNVINFISEHVEFGDGVIEIGVCLFDKFELSSDKF